MVLGEEVVACVFFLQYIRLTEFLADVNGEKINSIFYADDRVLIAATPNQLQLMITKLNEAGKHEDKCKQNKGDGDWKNRR